MTDATARVREQVLLLCEQDADMRTLRLALLPLLRRVIGFDAYVWLVTDPERRWVPRRWPTSRACRSCHG